jgi:hypothetical protein
MWRSGACVLAGGAHDYGGNLRMCMFAIKSLGEIFVSFVYVHNAKNIRDRILLTVVLSGIN